MGKISEALQKASDERYNRLDQAISFQEERPAIVVEKKESKPDSRLVPYFDSKSLVTEQYKSLATNLMVLSKGKTPYVIAVSSSIPSEGKTVTALNLSIVLSQAVHKPKVLLIDADMRKGKVIKYLGVKACKGLSEYLTQEAALNDIVFRIDIEHLSFISCGNVPLRPADLLASSHMKDLIRQLSGEFEYIVIDTPPVIPVCDAVITSGLAEGVLLVIRSGHTQRGMVKRSHELLCQGHAKILGHVLTGIEYFVPSYIYRYL